MLEKELKELGFDDKEAIIYVALLELGPSPVTLIAKKTGIKRTAIYYDLENLAEKGYISETIENKKKKYIAEDPEKIKRIFQERIERLNQIIPDLNNLATTNLSKPSVRYFVGKEGLKTMYLESLNLPKKPEILGFVSDDPEIFLPEFIKAYISKRAKKKISYKGIIKGNKRAREFKRQSKQLYFDLKLIPVNLFDPKIEINIYGNKVVFVSFEYELLGVMIESKIIADAMRQIFNLVWGKY
jgi:sugar-specific transcriptional regulator TrmB